MEKVKASSTSTGAITPPHCQVDSENNKTN